VGGANSWFFVHDQLIMQLQLSQKQRVSKLILGWVLLESTHGSAAEFWEHSWV